MTHAVTLNDITSTQRQRALWFATIALATCVAVWLVFSIVGLKLQQQFALNGTQFGLLLATPVLTGSLTRLPLGIWAEIIGARNVMTIVMLTAAAFTFALPLASSFIVLLLLALGLGVAGGAFSVGVVYVSAWFPREQQGVALGTFGAGNVGSAITSLAAPVLLGFMDWQHVVWVYAAVMFIAALLFFVLTQPVPHSDSLKVTRPGFRERIAPLHDLLVWQFSIYYFLVFGGFVALASWLPRFYMGVYNVDITTAGQLAACFLIPATLLRSVGGALADRYGARRMMYIAFSVCVAGFFLLSYPNTHYVVEGIRGPIAFSIAPSTWVRAIVLFIVGTGMAFGMAAVFKQIPDYYPQHVGAVGGVVSMIGGLGGFFLPISFGAMNDLVGIWTSCFMLMFGIAVINLLWMHFAIHGLNLRRFPQMASDTDLPEIMKAKSSPTPPPR